MAEAKHALDMFRVLEAIDTRQRDFYATLTDEERKDFKPLVAMRWLSSVTSVPLVEQHYLQMTNELVNVNFWELSKHPELQMRLMMMVGAGRKMRHNWIAFPKRTKTKAHDFIQQWWPHANDLEIEILLNQYTKETFSEFVYSTGMLDKDAKEIVTDFERTHGNARQDV